MEENKEDLKLPTEGEKRMKQNLSTIIKGGGKITNNNG